MSSSGGCAKGNALILQTARDMWAKGGFRFFFRGLPAGLIGVFPYSAIDMSTFEGIKLAYTKWAGEEPGIAGSLCFGAISGGVGASSVYPLCALPLPLSSDVLSSRAAGCSVVSEALTPPSCHTRSNLVRTRLQAQGTPAHPQTYLGVRDAATKCYQREGWRGFYKGLTPTLVKVIPAVAISCASSFAVVCLKSCGAGRSTDGCTYAHAQTLCTTRARSSCLRRSRRTTTMATRTSRERAPIAACSRPGPLLSTSYTHGRRRSIPTPASFAARPLSPPSLRRRRLHRPALLCPASCRPLLSPSSPLHRPRSSHPLRFSLAISRLSPPAFLHPFAALACSSREPRPHVCASASSSV